MKKIFAILLVLSVFLPASFAVADETEEETEEDIILVWVNGQEVTQSELQVVEESLLSLREANGDDISDEDVAAEVYDQALDQLIEGILIDQDMEALGFCEYSEEDFQIAQEAAEEEYAHWCAYYTEVYYYYIPDGSEEDAASFSKEMVDYIGYTEENLTDLYLESYASESYRISLTADVEINEEEIETAYEEDVERDKSAYADDIEAFEEALYYSDDQIWYIPDGYRAFRQILLPAEGEDEESMIASVQDTVNEINERREAGDDIETLIEEYGNASDNGGDFYREGGYWIHPNSVIWDKSITAAAFGENVKEIGDITDPVAGSSKVYLLIYVGDVESGPVDLTDDLKIVLEEEIRASLQEERYAERVEELKESAEIVYEN